MKLTTSWWPQAGEVEGDAAFWREWLAENEAMAKRPDANRPEILPTTTHYTILWDKNYEAEPFSYPDYPTINAMLWRAVANILEAYDQVEYIRARIYEEPHISTDTELIEETYEAGQIEFRATLDNQDVGPATIADRGDIVVYVNIDELAEDD